jgi:hypothetical protein
MSIRPIALFALLVLYALPFARAHAQDPRYGNGPGYGGGYGDAVDCKSSGYNLQRCPVPWRDAQLVRQLSDTPCRRGQNWGFDRQGLWVDRGCGGRFVAADGRGHGPGYGGGGDWRPGAGWNHRFDVSCSSPQYQRYFCQVDAGGDGRIYLSRQTSKSACIEGRTWGWNRAGIWVDQGCAGVFTVDRRWR